MLACKCWTTLLSGAKGQWDCTPWVKSDIYDCLVVIVIIVKLAS